MSREAQNIRKTDSVNPLFIDAAVDFIRTYADRTHHGKEEDILFKELGRKRLNEADGRMMNELVEEHRLARSVVKDIIHANGSYVRGEKKALGEVREKLEWLILFYPEHIKKEDKVFFPNIEKYFTEEESAALLSAFWEFDRRMIHEKYARTVEELKQRSG